MQTPGDSGEFSMAPALPTAPLAPTVPTRAGSTEFQQLPNTGSPDPSWHQEH